MVLLLQLLLRLLFTCSDYGYCPLQDTVIMAVILEQFKSKTLMDYKVRC